MIVTIFLLSLMLIAGVHEAGHYFLARFFKVGVQTVSIGFGGKMLSFYAKKQGTYFQLGFFPVGGYVKFSEEEMPTKVLYRSLAAWKKIVILMAGPLFNLLMAFIILFGLLRTTNYQMYPMIILPHVGKVKISHLNHQAVSSWSDVNTVFDKDHEISSIELKRLSDDTKLHVQLKSAKAEGSLKQWLALQGFQIYEPVLPAIIGGFTDGSVAKAAGFQQDDEIFAINDEPISDIKALQRCLEKYPDTQVNVDFWRHGKMLSITLKLSSIYRGHQKVGVLGIHTYKLLAYPKWYHQVQYTYAQTLKRSMASVAAILGVQSNGWKNIDKNYHSISGPIGIAYASYQAWSIGFKSYCLFLVWLNLALGFMNLLPLPILDGGQCLLVLVEKYVPQLLTDLSKNLISIISIIALSVLMALGIHNDWSYLPIK